MLDKTKATGKSMATKPSGQWKKGQKADARSIANTHKGGGEHDLSKVRVDERIINRIKGNIGKGWKTEYKPEFAIIAVEMLSKENQCFTLRLLCAVIGCSERTMYHWIEKHDDFAQAIAYGKSLQEVHFGNILLQGFKYARSVEIVLTNLHDWSSKKEERHTVVDLNKEIAEREAFAANHRARKKVDWREGEIIDAKVMIDPVTQENKDKTFGESRGEGIKEKTEVKPDPSEERPVPDAVKNNPNVV